MSVDVTLRKAAKLAKSGNRAGAAALYREVLAKFPNNQAARKGLAALSTPPPGAAPRPGGGAMPGRALGAGLIPDARPVAPPPGLAPAPASAKRAPQGKPAAAPAGATARRAPSAGPTPSDAQMQALHRMMAQGEVGKVVAEGQRLARLFPKAPALLTMLAQARARLGQTAEALAGFDRVLEIDPGFAGAHVNKASIYALSGKFDEAERAARAALAIDPAMPQALMNLGYALVNTGRAREAIAPFEAAVKGAPDMIQSHLGLGNAHAALREAEAALASFEKAHAIEPDNTKILNNVANALVALKRFDEAVEHFAAASARDPKNAVLHANYARALRELGRGPEAVDICRHAIAVDESNAEAWLLLGSTLRELGDTDGAVEALDRARALEPDNLQALGIRWNIDTLPVDHPDFARIEKLIDDENGDAALRGRFALALFKSQDKAGAPGKAMPWLIRGKALLSAADPYDLDAHAEMLNALIDTFSAGVAPLGEDDMAAVPPPARPVFIVGMPRSGTSLVEQILASHSQVHGAGELPTIGALMHRFGWDLEGTPRPFDRETLLELRRDYFDNLTRIGVDKPVVTDKSPLNFRHMGPALAAMPEARVLFMRRDSRATCWSNFSNNFMGRANNFGNDMLDTARMYHLHLRFLDVWRTQFPDRVSVVPYERLTEHQEEESRKLVAAAGLDWEDACLDFHKTKRAVRTVSAQQVRKKMYTGSSDAWRRYAAYIKPMLDALEGLDED